MTQTREQKLEQALECLLFVIDYTAGNCRPTKMIAGLVEPVLFRNAREALAMAKQEEPKR